MIQASIEDNEPKLDKVPSDNWAGLTFHGKPFVTAEWDKPPKPYTITAKRHEELKALAELERQHMKGGSQ